MTPAALAIYLDTIKANPPLHPAASDEERALLTWAAEHAIDRPTAPVSNGRYRLPHPTTGKGRTWTRMSNLAKTIDDGEGLTIWRMRLVTAGHKARPQLLEGVDLANPATVNAATTAAAIWGGDNLRAALGTAMHTALEHLVLGHPERPPAPWNRDLDAIARAIDQAGLTFPPELVEATLVNVELEAAGRTDLVAHGPWSDEVRICDLKTGKSINNALTTYAAQLAGYATAPWRWTPDGYQPFDGIDQATGLLIHAPLGTGTCTIHELNLTVGAEIVRLCQTVRKRRTGSQALATTLVTVDGDGDPMDPSDPDDRAAAIKTRLSALTDPDVRAQIVRGWPDGAPHKPPWTTDQAAALEALLWGHDGVETPFDSPPTPTPSDEPSAPVAPDPTTRAPDWPTPDNGRTLNTDDTAPLLAAVAGLTDDQRATARIWNTEAKREGRPWGPSNPMSERTYAVNLAALRLIQAFTTEAEQRCCIEYATGVDLAASWPTGAVLGALTIEQAADIEEAAARHRAGDETIRAVIHAATTGDVQATKEPTS